MCNQRDFGDRSKLAYFVKPLSEVESDEVLHALMDTWKSAGFFFGGQGQGAACIASDEQVRLNGREYKTIRKMVEDAANDQDLTAVVSQEASEAKSHHQSVVRIVDVFMPDRMSLKSFVEHIRKKDLPSFTIVSG